jgi:pyruvate,water dikinase
MGHVLHGAGPGAGARVLWDSSNIAESFNGVTTPLTFSFARRACAEVYRRFYHLLGVPASVLADKDDVFAHMLGLIRGRVYNNLLNWYRAMALLPGFTVNRRFMEQMMGLKEGLPESVASELAQAGWGDRLRAGFRLVRSAAALALNHVLLRRRIRAFHHRVEAALGPAPPGLDQLRPDELATQYRQLERRLLPRWDAPLLNDFFLMVFHGVLRKRAARWCGDGDGALVNDLLRGQGGMVSAEPADRARALARLATAEPGLAAALREASLETVRRAIDRAPAFRTRFHEYLDRFGERCLNELKLESPTLHADPLVLLRTVGQLAQRDRDASNPPNGAVLGASPEPCRQAERRVRATLRFRPLRRLVFGWLLRQVRARLRDRENLRFERTRVFGRARALFVELGRRFQALGVLDQPGDIFCLEVDEILGFIDGTATCTDLRGLAALRRAEFDRYRQTDPPPERFETCGMVHQGDSFALNGPATPAPDPGGDRRAGIGCCPGMARGRARVVTDPRAAGLCRGEILVAERTDPGWVILFPAAAGLVMEWGSLLSHAAIVAREIGLPTVVAVPGATRWLKDGDWIELDGGRGTVRKIGSGAEVSGDGQSE